MPEQYSLSIKISNTASKELTSAGMKVCIVKSRVSGDSGKNVVWVTVPTNSGATTVAWEDTFEMYASSTSYEAGATISNISQNEEPLYPNSAWLYEAGSWGKDSTQVFTDKKFHLTNEDTARTFGLVQASNVSGMVKFTPVSATTVMKAMAATFEPYAFVTVFVSATFNNGVVITEVSGKGQAVKFSTTDNAKTVEFDLGSGMFRPVV